MNKMKFFLMFFWTFLYFYFFEYDQFPLVNLTSKYFLQHLRILKLQEILNFKFIQVFRTIQTSKILLQMVWYKLFQSHFLKLKQNFKILKLFALNWLITLYFYSILLIYSRVVYEIVFQFIINDLFKLSQLFLLFARPLWRLKSILLLFYRLLFFVIAL